MKVCVIGAGLIGCATAYQLGRLGHDVLLVDAAGDVGLGTSFANGAQLSYSYVEPFASGATLRAVPGMLLSRDSPVRFHFRADPALWAWIAAFLRACTAAEARRGTEALLQLAALSRSTLEAWMADEGWDFAFQRNGKLVLCPTVASLDHQRRQVELQARMGCRQVVLDRQACIAREPALADSRDAFVGGVWTEDECVGDPLKLCRAMKASIERQGGRFLPGTQVQRFVVEGRRIVAALAGANELRADAFVLANGVAAPALARQVGVSLPVQPLKGYSLTLPVRPGRTAPVASVTSLGRKTVFAPLAGQLRVAAMVEVGANDLSIPPDRIRTMVEATEAVYPGLCTFDDPQPWAGLRPATPTSRPRIGATPLDNFYVNVGHGALGLTLAAGSAVTLAGMMRSG